MGTLDINLQRTRPQHLGLHCWMNTKLNLETGAKREKFTIFYLPLHPILSPFLKHAIWWSTFNFRSCISISLIKNFLSKCLAVSREKAFGHGLTSSSRGWTWLVLITEHYLLWMFINYDSDDNVIICISSCCSLKSLGVTNIHYQIKLYWIEDFHYVFRINDMFSHTMAS